MNQTRYCWPSKLLLLALIGISLGLASPGTAFAELTTQFIYTSATSENYEALSRLVQAPNGNFYGTALPSNPNLPGYLFRLTP